MSFIRRMLLRSLGIEQYLRIISKVYIRLIQNGFLKNTYPEIFFLKKILKQGDICIDIGANLAYYSIMISELIGSQGKLIAVEPIPLFINIWKKNMRMSKYFNYKILPYALGETERIVKMGLPEKNGIVRHGLTKIIKQADEKYVQYFDVQMKIPDKIFMNYSRIDFIKCDVEGYEKNVFFNMKQTILLHKPFIQTELGNIDDREELIEWFKTMGYIPKILFKKDRLINIREQELREIRQDFYFVP